MSVTVPRYTPPAARVLPSNVFYGWYVALACAVLMLVGVGVGYYGLAVFLRPLKEEHGWSTTAVSGATGLYFAISGVAAALVGGKIDRSGPMRFMIVGMLGTSVSIGLVGYVQSLWQLYLLYSALAVSFGISSAVAVNAIMTRWFVRKRARAMSISATGVSVGGVILAPTGTKLIDIGGLELASPIMGALVAVVAVPVILLVIAWDPRQMGLQPDGDPLDAMDTRSPLSRAAQLRQWERREVVRSMAFWGILIAFLLVLAAQTGYIIHQISFLEDRFGSRNTAAFALSLTAFGSIVARLIVGVFADAVDKRLLTVALFLMQGTAVLVIALVDNVPLTWVLTLVFGFTIGNVYMMQSLLVGEVFGMVSFGAVFGMVSLAGQIGSGGGPLLVGGLEDLSGGYATPFVVTAIVTYAAALAILLVRPVGAVAEARAEAANPVAAGGD
ncbi:MAG: MFS transporter [Dehalococcoidia bacterium]